MAIKDDYQTGLNEVTAALGKICGDDIRLAIAMLRTVLRDFERADEQNWTLNAHMQAQKFFNDVEAAQETRKEGKLQ